MKQVVMLQVTGDVDTNVSVEDAQHLVRAALDQTLTSVDPLHVKLALIPKGDQLFGVQLQLMAHTSKDITPADREDIIELNESASQNFGRIWEYCFASAEVESVVKRMKTLAGWMATAASMIPETEE